MKLISDSFLVIFGNKYLDSVEKKIKPRNTLKQ